MNCEECKHYRNDSECTNPSRYGRCSLTGVLVCIDYDKCTIAEPKPKELRDGDIIAAKDNDERSSRCYCVGICGAGVTHIQPNSSYTKDRKPLFNLYDLIDFCVQEGGCVVALTKETINEMLNERFSGHIRVGASKGFDALRRAMEGRP